MIQVTKGKETGTELELCYVSPYPRLAAYIVGWFLAS